MVLGVVKNTEQSEMKERIGREATLECVGSKGTQVSRQASHVKTWRKSIQDRSQGKGLQWGQAWPLQETGGRLV